MDRLQTPTEMLAHYREPPFRINSNRPIFSDAEQGDFPYLSRQRLRDGAVKLEAASGRGVSHGCFPGGADFAFDAHSRQSRDFDLRANVLDIRQAHSLLS